MHKINLFVEDFGHERFLDALLQRLAKRHNLLLEVNFSSSRGGYGTAIKELKKYIRDLQRGRESSPDLLIVATDGNCKGFSERKQQIEEVTKEFTELVICAIPDPHIERWLLLDSAAFKKVLGKGCTAPIQKCERDLYKRLLDNAITNAGKETLFDGMEYAKPIVDAMDLAQMNNWVTLSVSF